MRLSSAYGLARSLLVYYGQVWRRGRLENFYSQFLRPGDLAFDIGSHVGNRVRAWRRLQVRVVAVEPQPLFMRLLSRLFSRDPQVVLERCGVAAQAGTGTLWISHRTPTVSSCSRDWIEDMGEAERFKEVRWEESLEVPMHTLDQLIDRHGTPAFCKIDIEGGELDALKGLSQPLPALSFECVSASTNRALACIDRLEELGEYRYRYSQLETMRWSTPSWLDARAMRQQLCDMSPNSPAGDVYACSLDHSALQNGMS